MTDYASVYDDAYRDRRGSHTSFDVGLLSTLLAAFCREVGVTNLLDVSGGQGRLTEALHPLGIRAVTTDIAGASGSPVIPFDLSRHAAVDIARVQHAIQQAWNRAPHVTCCFDVLEHIDREDVAASIRNLATLTGRWLVVSISTRPSSRDNLFHASIFPLQTWIRVLEAAGFRLRPTEHFSPVTNRVAANHHLADPLVDRWRLVDPFGDLSQGEPLYLVLEKLTDVLDWTLVEAEIEKLLDVAYRREKRRQFHVQPDTRYLLSLHHVQEFAILRPLLDVLPRDAVRVVLRRPFIEENHFRAINGFLARTGVQTHIYERAEELPWSELTGRVFVTAADSSCAVNHICGLQISALARLHGCRTFLLQHGIWPRPFPGRIVTFGADHVLNWGTAEERILQQNTHRIGAAETPWGLFSPGQVHRIGSPRYTDQLLPAPPDGLDLRLGLRRDRFAATVLLATKNFRHGPSDFDVSFGTALVHLIETNPETLFLVRPHPATTDDVLLALRRENVRFLDETCCITADIPLCRIVPFVDRVVTPVSTIALDGAISGKTVIVCDGGQASTYDHLKSVHVEQLPEVLHDREFLDGAESRGRQFRNTYAESVDTLFYEHFAALLATPSVAPATPDVSLAVTVSLAAEVELQWHGVRHARAISAQRVTELEADEAKLRDKAAALTKEIDALRQELERMKLELATRHQGLERSVLARLRRAGRSMGRMIPRNTRH